MYKKIPIEVSARHVHLSQKDLEKLFGKGYKLKKLRQLTQSCDFAAKETLDIEANGKKILKMKIVGPTREKTQIEISLTDAIYLKLATSFKDSGDIDETPGINLIGPDKQIKIEEGVIIPWRHIHCTPAEAKELGLKNGEFVSVEVKGDRAVIFHNVKIRVRNDYKLCLHLDTDEGNAAGIDRKGEGFLLNNQ